MLVLLTSYAPDPSPPPAKNLGATKRKTDSFLSTIKDYQNMSGPTIDQSHFTHENVTEERRNIKSQLRGSLHSAREELSKKGSELKENVRKQVAPTKEEQRVNRANRVTRLKEKREELYLQRDVARANYEVKSYQNRGRAATNKGIASMGFGAGLSPESYYFGQTQGGKMSQRTDPMSFFMGGGNPTTPGPSSQPQRPVSAADYNLLNLGRSSPRASKKKGMNNSPMDDPYRFYFGG